MSARNSLTGINRGFPPSTQSIRQRFAVCMLIGWKICFPLTAYNTNSCLLRVLSVRPQHGISRRRSFYWFAYQLLVIRNKIFPLENCDTIFCCLSEAYLRLHNSTIKLITFLKCRLINNLTIISGSMLILQINIANYCTTLLWMSAFELLGSSSDPQLCEWISLWWWTERFESAHLE